MKNIFKDIITDKEGKISFNKKITYFITAGITILTFIKGFSNYYLANKMANLYGIPSYYFYNDTIYGLFSKIVLYTFILTMLFIPIIIKKLSDHFKFRLTKFDSWYYTVVGAINWVIILLTVLHDSIIFFETKDNAYSFNATISVVIVIGILIGMCFLTKKYFDLLVFKVNIKIANNKIKPDYGHKFITFDFNGGNILGEKKQPVICEVPIGCNISDAEKYIKKNEGIHGIKKDDKKLSYWSDNIAGIRQYSDKIITKNFNDNNVLYAQYNDKDCINRDNIGLILVISSLVIFISIIGWWTRIDSYYKNPENIIEHEFVSLGEKQDKIIVGYYNDKAILMDYKICDNKPDVDSGNVKLKYIKIKKGQFYLKTLDGEKIVIKKCKIINDEKSE